MSPTRLPKVIEEAVTEALSPSVKRMAAGLLVLVKAGIRGNSKSDEELLLDIVEGKIAAEGRREVARVKLQEIASDPNFENQRILAREAARYVPIDRFLMPAIPIAGRIFRESEFEQPGSPIWAMWVQLLARACDKDRVGEAHPSFPWIISQLSSDEAKLIASMHSLQPRSDLNKDPIPFIDSAALGVVFGSNIQFYISHLGILGLLVTPSGMQPTAHLVMIDDVLTYMLTNFGHTFISAVSEPPKGPEN